MSYGTQLFEAHQILKTELNLFLFQNSATARVLLETVCSDFTVLLPFHKKLSHKTST